MPISRKRKKTRKSRRPGGPTSRQLPSTPIDRARSEPTDLFAQFLAGRRSMGSRREAAAAEAAEAVVGGLTAWVPDRTEVELEDELCRRVGLRLREWEDSRLEVRVAPSQFAEALLAAAAGAVHAAVAEPGEPDGEPDGWRAPWRVFAAVARLLPYPVSESAGEVVNDLRQVPGGRALPARLDEPVVRGPVLWTRDAYGSRFGITAAFAIPGGPERWYLWDVDACGYQPFTIHAGYYPTCEEALAAWRAGVGQLAAGAATLSPVDDWSLLVGLLPAEEGILRAGGTEDVEQFEEYYRGKRLAEVALAAVGSSPPPVDKVARADVAERAAAEFAAWLPTRRTDLPVPADLAERAAELADSWSFASPPELYHTCSPHRVASNVLHLRNYYQDDFAAELIELLPDWVAWLATRSGTPPELVERCHPYALGQAHVDVGSDDSRPNYLARVSE